MLTNYYLPKKVLTNDDLAAIYDQWTPEKIFEKTGISQRHIADSDECASDLAFEAAEELILQHKIKREEIDFLLFATQSPDYFLPTTACVLQEKLKLSQHCGALDYNLGCSAYIYGLALAKSLLSSGVASKILLLTAETYSKYIHPQDKSVRTLFGDGGAATLLQQDDVSKIGQFVLGTEGAGYQHLIVPVGGSRRLPSDETKILITDRSNNKRTEENLYMNGGEIFNFTIKKIPETVDMCLKKNGLQKDDIDLFIFHQANAFILNYLRKIIKIPQEKFFVELENIGNTVSASIPIALTQAYQEGKIHPGNRVMLVGFGVGLSWGATILTW